MDDLTIGLVQFDIAWHDWRENVRAIEKAVKDLDPCDLILLPETFASGFSMVPQQVAQTMDGPVVEWMSLFAADRKTDVAGSLIVKEGDNYFNRFVYAHSDGSLTLYDKKHLFTYAGEHDHFSPGNHIVEIELKGWRIRPLVCYDLRFPVWSRNTTDYDVLIYVANWPAARVHAWQALLRARSIENLCYTIGLNRVGTDGNDIPYSGSTEVFDMAGNSLLRFNAKPQTGVISLNRKNLEDFRSRYNFLADRDSFSLE